MTCRPHWSIFILDPSKSFWIGTKLFGPGSKKQNSVEKVNSRPKCFGPIYVQSIRSLLNLITNMHWFLKILGSKDNSRTQYNQVCPKCLNNVYIYFCRRMFIMYDPISTSVKSPHTIQGYTLAEITNDCEQVLNVSK